MTVLLHPLVRMEIEYNASGWIFKRKGAIVMKKFLFMLFCSAMVLFGGCVSRERLPAEDLEVPVVCADEILILRNPNIPPNSKEKYDAIKRMLRKVDFTFTRETKTLNALLYHGDGTVDVPNQRSRTITFNYQYEDHYVRLSFVLYDTFVLRTDVEEK